MSAYRPGLAVIKPLAIYHTVDPVTRRVRDGYAVMRDDAVLAWFPTEEEAKAYIAQKWANGVLRSLVEEGPR